MKFHVSLMARRNAKIRQDITQSDEMMASHHGRNRGLAKQWVVITQINNGLKHAKNHGSKYG